jgi:hypothetical protein
LSSSRANRCSPASMYVGCGDQSTIARREINSRLGGMASTYARVMSPPGGETSVGLQSVRFNSELHGRVRVVCLFCTREPSCSHLAPCGLFVSAPGTRHASALGGMAPKFFRWIHCGTSSKEPTSLGVKFKVASQFQHSLKKDMLRRSNVATSLANSTCQCR